MLCRYERTIFKSDKGFCIFAYSTSDESVPKEARNRSYYHDDKIHFTAIGYHLIATDAVEVELDGTWENSKHGLQLSVSMCKEVVPRDQAGILAYLSSGIIKGIGPETAKAIVARFGDKTIEVLEKEPDKLLSVKGIAQKKLKAIIKSYGETKALSDLMIYLAPFGVSMKKVAMIREEFGDNSLRIVKTDPFQLCKIKGFGFMTVDSVARKTKVSLKHPLRYSGAINYVLDEARVSGHLFLSVDETVGQCYELLNMGCDDEVVSEEEIRQAISNERVESRIYVEGSRVYLSYERMCEVKSAKRIVSMILQEGFTQFCMNGDALAGIIADAPIKMPPDEDAGHPGSVVASFTAQPTADPPAFSQTATAPKSTQPAQQQVQPPVQQSHAPAPEPPKTLDEYLRVMTIEQAKAVKVDFGRFSGWSLGEIAMKSPGDLAWYVKNYSGHNLALKAGATKLLETVGQMAS